MSDAGKPLVASFSDALALKKRVRCFMDGIDWDCELGCASDGNRLYPSEDALRAHAGHDLEECGIVEVEVRLVRWVRPSRY